MSELKCRHWFNDAHNQGSCSRPDRRKKGCVLCPGTRGVNCYEKPPEPTGAITPFVDQLVSDEVLQAEWPKDVRESGVLGLDPQSWKTGFRRGVKSVNIAVVTEVPQGGRGEPCLFLNDDCYCNVKLMAGEGPGEECWCPINMGGRCDGLKEGGVLVRLPEGRGQEGGRGCTR